MQNLYKLFTLVIGINSLLLLFNQWTYHHQFESNQINQTSASRVLDNNNKSDMKQLFCFILTTKNNLKIRVSLKKNNFGLIEDLSVFFLLHFEAQIVSNTWAKHCDKHVFVLTIKDKLFASLYPNTSLEVNEPFPLLQPAGFIQDNYTRLTDKVYATFKHIYSHYNDYHWYLKADNLIILFENPFIKVTMATKSQPIYF